MFDTIDGAGKLKQRAIDGAFTSWSTVTRIERDPSTEARTPREFDAHPTIDAMASVGNVLFASTSDNDLLRTDTDRVDESGGWHRFHHCDGSVGLAAIGWMLFVATSDEQLWRMDVSGLRVP